MCQGVLRLEVVGETNLPSVRASAILRDVGKLQVASSATSDVVVGRQLEMVDKRYASSDVDAELRRLEFPLCGRIYFLRLVADVKAKLRTGEEEYVGQAAQADAIAQIDRNLYRL